MQISERAIEEASGSNSPDMRPLFAMHADMCQALANQYRLAIMYALKDGEKCVGDIGVEVGISVQNVSQHLRILKERLLVRSRKEGQTVYYSVTNPKFVQACALIREALIEQHRAAGERLEAAGALEALSAMPE